MKARKKNNDKRRWPLNRKEAVERVAERKVCGGDACDRVAAELVLEAFLPNDGEDWQEA